jgi:hypothetical protein
MALPFDRYEIFAALSIAMGTVRYGTYLWSIYQGKTHPHVYTWFNMGVITGIGTYAQFALGGGPSAWALAFVSAVCLLISFVSIFVGTRDITRSDAIAALGALLIIPVWKMTSNPVLALILVIAIDILSYYPTIRKSYHAPWSEPALSAFWSGVRYFFAILAVSKPGVDTLFYPVYLMLTDWGFMLYILWRRWAKRHGK